MHASCVLQPTNLLFSPRRMAVQQELRLMPTVCVLGASPASGVRAEYRIRGVLMMRALETGASYGPHLHIQTTILFYLAEDIQFDVLVLM